MVENYPTSLRVLVLAENDISPELQQQIGDLLSEGEDDDDREALPLVPDPASITAFQQIRDKYHPIRDKYQLPAWLPHSSKGWLFTLSSVTECPCSDCLSFKLHKTNTDPANWDCLPGYFTGKSNIAPFPYYRFLFSTLIYYISFSIPLCLV